MEMIEAKQVRFSKLVEEGGEPAAYLPFGDPEKDKSFMRAVKEERVVTIKQEPTSKHKDFGVVGFLKEKYVTYLIFAKSLGPFGGQRVIGIKYDTLSAEKVIPFGGPQPPRAKAKATKEPPKHEPAPRPEPRKEKPAPEPKHFSVRVRVTATAEKEVEVTAWNKREAEGKAREEVQGAVDFSSASTQTKVVQVRELGQMGDKGRK
jgi:hypothetical protein